ncbi:MAG: ABC transporter ATP-binding protein [Christensenellaceae bacterium]|jgi:ABC-type multidrug transport system fused ATPase/permease subunit
MKQFKQDLTTAKAFLQLSMRISRAYIPLSFCYAIICAASILPNIFLPKYIIDALMSRETFLQVLLYVVVLIVLNTVFSVLKIIMQKLLQKENLILEKGLLRYMGEKSMQMNYALLEDIDTLQLKEKAQFPIRTQNILKRVSDTFSKILEGVVTIVTLLAIITTLHIAVLLLIAIIIVINFIIFSKLQKLQMEWMHQTTDINKNFGYLFQLTSDFTYAKEIRLYHMAPYIKKKLETFADESVAGFRALYNKIGRYEGLASMTTQVVMVLICGFAALQIKASKLSLGDFSVYASSAVSFTKNITELVLQIINFQSICQYLQPYMEYVMLPSENAPEVFFEAERAQTVSIEFKDVWFRYPKTDYDILKGINLVIQAGKSLSLVGENGAGKTTLIKLLCRLYRPTSGQILLNGRDIYAYATEEYNACLGVVFQDFKLFDFSIKENVMTSMREDENRLEEAIEQAGMQERINALKDGMDTVMYSRFQEDGVMFSGGEQQKIAIARVIYKDAPIVILDEPTAALDPYAEAEIYEHFHELAEGKMTIFVSHRLSSCKFCDDVAVLENGQIIEYGSHDKLLEDKQKYAAMWKLQAQYYEI